MQKLIGMVFFGFSIVVQSAVLCVAPVPSNCDMSVCASAHATIQAAVNAAATSGDEIRVAQGVYTGSADVTLPNPGGDYVFRQVALVNNKSIALRGGFNVANWNTPNPKAYSSVIDAQGNGRGMTLYGVSYPLPTMLVEGFTIQNGNYSDLGNADSVGNHNCSRTSSDCGGGLWVKNVNITLRNMLIQNNIASTTSIYSDGGGIFLWYCQVVLENVTLLNNKVGSPGSSGAGIASFYGTDYVISNSVFEKNSVSDTGGAVRFFQPSGSITITDSTFRDNNATTEGGAISFDPASALPFSIARTRFENNRAGTGSVLMIRDAGSSSKQVVLENLLLTGNASFPSHEGSLIHIPSPTKQYDINLTHLTVADNSDNMDSFLHVEAPSVVDKRINLLLQNTILDGLPTGVWFRQDAGEGTIVAHFDHLMTHDVTHPDVIEGETPEIHLTGNSFGVDPKLGADYKLLRGSPAIDAAVASGVAEDIDGIKRPFGSAFDIGAYELHQSMQPSVIMYLLN